MPSPRQFCRSAIDRRGATALLLTLAGAATTFSPARALTVADLRFGPARRFSWQALVAEAQRLARRPFVARAVSGNAATDFDAHVRLAYGQADALAGDVRLFPTRRDVAPYAVGINLVEAGKARKLLDTTGLFGGGQRVDVAGFRVMKPDMNSDWLAFLGASYFRTDGAQGQFGLSARGVAVNTGLPGPEEFPAFTDFWIEHLTDSHFRIHALLDGPSLTGAIAIDSQRGTNENLQDVRLSLFLRRDVARLGVAPQTSMFLCDPTRIGPVSDRHSAVHDSDGLAIRSGDGERIWRPLRQPPAATIYSFRADHPRGFGLLQRDRIADHYREDGSAYAKRPSLWTEPRGDWGAGAVMLYEMASISENVDNIGAFWVSDIPARAGERRDLAYRLTWTSSDPSADSNARCTDITVVPAVTGSPMVVGARTYLFSFTGPSLRDLDRASGVEVVTDLPAGVRIAAEAYPLADAPATWQVSLSIRTTRLGQRDLRLFLRRGGAALSETVIMVIEP